MASKKAKSSAKKTSKQPRRRATKFVPRLALGVALVCVVPMCAAGCNGGPMGVADASFYDVTHDVADVSFREAGVADVSFREAGVADVAFHEAGVAADAFSVADSGFSVADAGFTVAADAFGVADSGFSVADTGFGPG